MKAAYLRGVYRVWAPLYDSLLERVFAFDRAQVIGKVPRGRVLEVGCGTGLNFPYYSKRHEVTGVDLSEAMLRRARKKGAHRLLCADARQLPFPDDSFDSAVATFFFRVTPDPEKVALELSRVVRPCGRLIVADTFSGQNWLDPLTLAVGWGRNPDLEGMIADSPWRIVSSHSLGKLHSTRVVVLENGKKTRQPKSI